MKYWGYLVAKVVLALAILCAIERVIAWMFPPLKPFHLGGPNPVTWYFQYTLTMMGFSLLACGIGWFIVWDQRYRCRTCVRKMRMPIQRGSWTNVLLGAPRTEYICLYGHGTLNVAGLQITGHQEPDWQPHDDMWKELLSLEDSKK